MISICWAYEVPHSNIIGALESEMGSEFYAAAILVDALACSRAVRLLVFRRSIHAYHNVKRGTSSCAFMSCARYTRRARSCKAQMKHTHPQQKAENYERQL